MLLRLQELEASWEGRLDRQRAVIDNLTEDRERLLRVVGAVERLVELVRPLTSREDVKDDRERGNYTTLLEALEDALRERG
jgi:hypothetical protein